MILLKRFPRLFMWLLQGPQKRWTGLEPATSRLTTKFLNCCECHTDDTLISALPTELPPQNRTPSHIKLKVLLELIAASIPKAYFELVKPEPCLFSQGLHALLTCYPGATRLHHATGIEPAFLMPVKASAHSYWASTWPWECPSTSMQCCRVVNTGRILMYTSRLYLGTDAEPK